MTHHRVRVANADRMMTAVEVSKTAIVVQFADDCRGSIPLADLPEIKDRSQVGGLELPNPYQMTVRTVQGDLLEIPWDFARAYCDPTYKARIEAAAKRGRRSLGDRVRQARLAAGRTQEEVADFAAVGRVTLARIESGRQSPRLETLISLAKALGRPVQELMLDAAEIDSAAPAGIEHDGRRAERPAKRSRPARQKSPVRQRTRSKTPS